MRILWKLIRLAFWLSIALMFLTAIAKGGDTIENPLAVYMREHEKSPREVSDDLGVSVATVYGWLKGNVLPSHGNARRMCRYVGAHSHLEFIRKWRLWKEVKDGKICTHEERESPRQLV